MTDSEIDFFGFNFDSDIEDKKDLSIVHFHNDDEDYCLTTDAPFYLWEAANAYVNTIKDVKDRWSLDSIAENIADGTMIDERIYPILCKSRHRMETLYLLLTLIFRTMNYLSSTTEMIFGISFILTIFAMHIIK